MIETKYICNYCGKEISEAEAYNGHFAMLKDYFGYALENVDLCSECRDKLEGKLGTVIEDFVRDGKHVPRQYVPF